MPLGNLRRYLGFTALLGTMVLAGCSSNEPFEEPSPLPDVVETVKLDTVWSMSVGDGHDGNFLYLQPTLVGDTLYAVAADGMMVSVSPENGKVFWQHELDRQIMAGVGADRNQLYLVSRNAELLSYGREEGDARWQAELPNEVLAPPQSNGSIVVVQTIDGKVLAFDTASGEKRWQYDGVVPILTIRGTATPLVGSELTLVAFANGQLFGLSSDNGQPLWQYAVGQPEGRTELERLVDVSAQPLVIDNAALVVGYQGSLAAVDIRNGQEIWRRNMSSLRTPTIAYGNVYVTESNGSITAVDGNSRQTVWSQDGLAWRQPSAPTVAGDQLMVGDFKGYLHTLALEDGAFTGQRALDSEGIRVPMLRWQDLVLVYTNGGRLAAVKVVPKD